MTTRRPVLAALLGSAALAATLIVGPQASPAEAAVTTSAPRTYYVNCARKSAGNGTASSPWRSIAAVNGHGAFHAGDRVLFKRASSCKGRLRPLGSGTTGEAITLGAWGKGSRPRIVGGGTAQHTGAIDLRNQHDWVIQDLDVTNSTNAAYTRTFRSGILVLNTGVGRLQNITIRRTRVHDVTSNLRDSSAGNSRQWGGISVLSRGPYGSGFDHVDLLDNVVDHVGRTGIVSWNNAYTGTHDTDVRIAGNDVRWARGDSYIGVGMLHSRIDHNRSAFGSNMSGCPNCQKISKRLANTGMWVGGAHYIRIDHNEVYGEHLGGGDGEAFSIDVSTSAVTLEYNYAHDNAGGGVLFCGSIGAVARFNIFENNGKSAVAFIGSVPASNTKIYNNTIYQSASSKGRTARYFNGAHGKGISFYNNVVYNYTSLAALWPTKVTSRNNTYIGRHLAGEPRGRGYSYKNPGLIKPGTGGLGFGSLKGYKVRKGVKGQIGVPIPASVKTDFFGKKIDPKKPPRGAAGR